MDLLTSIYGFAITLELLALVLCFLFLRNSILRFRRHPVTGNRKRKGRFLRDSSFFMCGLLLFLSGLVFINFGLILQTYRAFAVGKPIAEITVHADPNDDGYIVKISELGKPLNNETPLESEYYIRGDLWTVRGNIVRFHPTLSFLGFQPLYQLTRIQGDYYSFEQEKQDERLGKRTYYSLINQSDEAWWRWMMKWGDTIPIIDMTYGSSITHNAEEGSRYIITVLPSGFTIKKPEE